MNTDDVMTDEARRINRENERKRREAMRKLQREERERREAYLRKKVDEQGEMPLTKELARAFFGEDYDVSSTKRG